MKNTLPAVQVRGLTVAYDEKPVLWNVDLAIPMGTLTGIVGPNGAGKTTLMKAMLGLVKPLAGSVAFPWPGRGGHLPENKIGYVPQSGSVDWDFPATALDVVLMGRYGQLGWLRRPRRADRDMAKEMLDRVGMADYAARQISQLSGGQQQRVFLARALAQQAELYLMDEPFKGVDAQTEKTIVTLLKQLREQGKTVVVVHHDLQTVAEYFDWVTLMNTQVLASGPTHEVFCPQNIDLLYSGGGAQGKGAAAP